MSRHEAIDAARALFLCLLIAAGTALAVDALRPPNVRVRTGRRGGDWCIGLDSDPDLSDWWRERRSADRSPKNAPRRINAKVAR